jgi:FKBP-type peptidyl-prolyl cis-trans isomerase
MLFKIFQTLIITIFIFSCSNENSPAIKDLSKPENEKDKISYALGSQLGNQMKMDSTDLNTEYFFLGFIKAFKGDSSLLTSEEMQTILQEYSKKLSLNQESRMEEARAKLNEMTDKLKRNDPQFLEAYKKRNDVITTGSGLMYRILKKGNGRMPANDDIVKFNLIGKFTDGIEFDNTYKTNQPITLPVFQAMPGWKEAFPLMKIGSKWELVIPSNLGFGDLGYPAKNIPPNVVLICQIELLSIEGKAPAPPGQMQPPTGVSPMPPPRGNQP